MEVVYPWVSGEVVVATHAPPDPEPRMDAHQNARTTSHSRQLIVTRLAQGWRVSAVALALGIDATTVRKWRDRYAAEGEAGSADRSPTETPKPPVAERRLVRAAASAPPQPRLELRLRAGTDT